MASELRAVLRGATAREHESLDRLVSNFDLSLPRDYGMFLRLHAAVIFPLERWLESNLVTADLPDWPQRSRSAALASDLHHLDLHCGQEGKVSFDNSLPVKAGLLYVLEGSRLGGRVLLRRLEHAAQDLRTSFLQHGIETKLWPSFLAWLGELPQDRQVVEAAVGAAREVFAMYEKQARELLEEQG